MEYADDRSDTTHFLPGPLYLRTLKSDTIPYAVRLGGAANKFIRYDRFGSVAPVQIAFAGTYKIERPAADTVVLLFMSANCAGNSSTFVVAVDALNGELIVARVPFGADSSTGISVPIGSWQTFTVEHSHDASGSHVSVYFGDSLYIRRTLPYVGQVVSWSGAPLQAGLFMSSQQKAITDAAELCIFENMSGTEVHDLCYQWEADPQPATTDTITIPLNIQTIIYDPPGDGSSSILSRQNVIRQSLNVDQAWDFGFAAMYGFELELSIGEGISFSGNAIDIEMNVNADFSEQHYQEFTTETSFNEELQSSVDDALASYVGPGNGDIIMYQPLTIERKLYRRPKLGILTQAHDSLYVYYLLHRVLPDTSSRLRVSTVSDLLAQVASDSLAKALLLEESAAGYVFTA
ncbi:MAG: hypothetical protein GF398_07235 [Chitinivibrionales bacterium]|nr:hypothetical protein [Chitinivibrionales bacterium]